MERAERESSERSGWKWAVHVLAWGLVAAFPYVMLVRNNINIGLANYVFYGSFSLLSLLIMFYTVYLWLVPRFLMRGRVVLFFLLSIALGIVLSTGLRHWFSLLFRWMFSGGVPDFSTPPSPETGWDVRITTPPSPNQAPDFSLNLLLALRDAALFFVVGGIATIISMGERWGKMEKARQKTEKALTEAELQNLRNQLNPHFLLNTLNNIYALIAFDSERAQEAVQELSRLLRHVLYDNKQQFTTLPREVEFIKSYIELMRIRLASNVEVSASYDIRPDSNSLIAPLICISLIENAFKHGTSPLERSFVSVSIREEEHAIVCEIRNSYHPKKETDKSGSGIGLQQVRRRLDLNYPDRYRWEKGVSPDGREYFSHLTLATQ